jgi:Bleomycin resistance protein-like N-terminal
MSKMNSVVHFEMPYDDRERMAKFYQNAFGWQTRMLGEEMGNYVLATTTESDDGRPKKPGAINGGFYDWPAQHPSVVIGHRGRERVQPRYRRCAGTARQQISGARRGGGQLNAAIRNAPPGIKQAAPTNNAR